MYVIVQIKQCTCDIVSTNAFGLHIDIYAVIFKIISVISAKFSLRDIKDKVFNIKYLLGK